MDKRSFLKHLSMGGIATIPLFQQLDKLMASVSHLSASALAEHEDFWDQIRAGYRLKPDYINFENGYYCFMPQEILENYIHHIRTINYDASYYMRKNQWKNKVMVGEKLAQAAGCKTDELVITRNTTESLDLIISGYPWEKGDEAIMAQQDYGAMLNMFDQVAKRYGVVNKRLSIPNHPASDDEIVQLYADAITPKTKLLMVCHMINITGQILPVRKICDMAHARGVEVLVDGAHTFGHIDFNIPDLHCDYYGASLHKWLSAPLGAGILYVKKEKVHKIWPLLAEAELEPDNIYRLNHIGTHPAATDLAILNALEYQERIGIQRKEARLRFLQRYWTDQVRDLPQVIVNTPKDPHRSCAIANVGLKNMKSYKMYTRLFKEYRIWTVSIHRDGVFGCRIVPNIYTSISDLDILVQAITNLSKEEAPNDE